jgi:hypothetical protein
MPAGSQPRQLSEGNDQTAATPLRTFSTTDFRETPSWQRLKRILAGNGGCYGLYGPRGAGKSWLMMMAISWAKGEDGLGLWFPCPSQYDSSAFLSALSDNLANEVEHQFVRNSTFMLALRRSRMLLSVTISVPAIVAVVTYVVRSLTVRSQSGSIFSAIPAWLWLIVGLAVVLLAATYVAQFVWDSQPTGRLVREAIAFRERIRFTASLKLGAEYGLSGGSSLAATVRRSQEKALDERPTTVASLVYDFRNLARLIVDALGGPLVIGIDELDKIEKTELVRALLRDIKGIFEVAGVHFLVSVSEEALAALQLGPLQTGGRNEFNSSFYTIIELPPLDPADTRDLLQRRKPDLTDSQAQILCLLAAGNHREIIRMAEVSTSRPASAIADADQALIISTLEEESAAVLQDVIRSSTADNPAALSDEAQAGAWSALPRSSFSSVEAFVALGNAAILKYWQPDWSDDRWHRAEESWRRLLIRLFVAASVIAAKGRSGDLSPLSGDSAIADLRDVLIMATHNAGVARLMLQARFGQNLSRPYQA